MNYDEVINYYIPIPETVTVRAIARDGAFIELLEKLRKPHRSEWGGRDIWLVTGADFPESDYYDYALWSDVFDFMPLEYTLFIVETK